MVPFVVAGKPFTQLQEQVESVAQPRPELPSGLQAEGIDAAGFVSRRDDDVVDDRNKTRASAMKLLPQQFARVASMARPPTAAPIAISEARCGDDAIAIDVFGGALNLV